MILTKILRTPPGIPRPFSCIITVGISGKTVDEEKDQNEKLHYRLS